VKRVVRVREERVSASQGNPADHGFYVEMRDRSGFDFDGKGQNDRAPIAFEPGMLLVYTDENHGYGNVGVGDPPAQNPIDANPQPGVIAPNLDDAGFTAGGVSSFSDGGTGWVDNYTDPSRPDNRWRFDFGCLGFQVLAMSGQDIGPATSPGNLQGDVRFTTGSGCVPFDYGFGAKAPNFPPTAVAEAKPTATRVGRRVSFNGSASSDDIDTSLQLTYRWDFEGDGVYDATGRTARHEYSVEGMYAATLEVTDRGGKTDTDTVTIAIAP
jgi:immune inhibitor A